MKRKKQTKEVKTRKPARKAVKRKAWRGTWDRPMKMDETTLDPFTIARMTDHNSR